MRQAGAGCAANQSRRVVPVVTTGLHCGTSAVAGVVGVGGVVPVVTTGLHCGTAV